MGRSGALSMGSIAGGEAAVVSQGDECV